VVRGKRAVASRQRLSAEKPEQLPVVETVIAITCFQTRVSWHFSLSERSSAENRTLCRSLAGRSD